MSEVSPIYWHLPRSQREQLANGHLPNAAVSECNIDTLPDELLFEIINQVFLDDVDDVWTISFTNRRLHRVAKEILYSSYSTRDAIPGLFIRTLASSPDLERCVQQVEWEYEGHAFKFPEQLTTAELRHITERVGFDKVGRREVVGESRIRKLNTWLADHGREDQFNIFMLFTPRVKKVEIIPSLWPRKAVWFKSALEPQMFSNLQEASIILEQIRVGNILSLFLLPSLRTLILGHVGIHRDRDGIGPRPEWDADKTFWDRLEKDGSSLENLILPNVGGDTLDLARALESFQGLKKFKLAFHGHGMGPDDVNVRTLLRAIANHHESLASLDLNDFRIDNDPNTFEELRVLNRLEWLQMCGQVFYGVVKDEWGQLADVLPGRFKNLPRHIKHLRISAMEDGHNVPESLLEVLINMAPTINTIFSNLEKITFFDWHPQLGTFPCQKIFAALQNGLAKAGVELESIHNADGSSEAWYDRNRVATTTWIEPDWVWVELVDPLDGDEDDWLLALSQNLAHRNDADLWLSDAM
jgi:hypothetical protein